MFGIGFAPPGWDGLIKAASSKGIKPTDLERAGLAIKKEGYYDRFRNRLMIPIRSMAGRVIGFGGRVLPGDDSAKYINSPETDVYKKSRILYGLDISKNDLRAKNEAVVVEGYFDLITLYQYGIKNVVAVSGTGFTSEQATLLARFCERVVLLYDSDSAGIKAAFRACGILYNAGLEPRLVKLPGGFDPDSFVRQHGPERLSELLKEANDILDFVQQFIKGRFADQPLSKQKKIVNKLMELMEPIEDDLTRDLLSKKMFERIDIDSKTLGILGERRTAARSGSSDATLSAARDRVEREFLAILLMHPEQISKVGEVVEESLFTEERNARIFAAIMKFHAEGKDLDISELSEEVGDDGAGRCLREIALQEQPTSGWELEFEEYLNKFRMISVRKRLDELKGLISEAERMSDQDRIEILTREFQNLKLEVEANDARV
jgi:DNA primase